MGFVLVIHFLRGALAVERIVGLCRQHSMPAVALVDRGHLFAALEFALKAAQSGVQPIMGVFIGCESGYGLLSSAVLSSSLCSK